MVAENLDSPISPEHTPNDFLGTALELLERQGDSYWMRVNGGSMRPLIQEGDLLQIEPVPSSVRRGEIAAYRRGGQLSAHRVLESPQEVDRDAYVLARGDHALRPDPRIHIEQVVGRVTAIWRGEQVMRVDTPSWRAAGNLLALLLLGWSSVQRGQQQEATWLDGAVRKGIGGLIWCVLALIGRWEDWENQS